MAPKERALTKNERKRAKKKEAKLGAKEEPPPPPEDDNADGAPPLPDDEPLGPVEVEYVSAAVDVEPGMEDFKAIFEKFASAEEVTAAAAANGEGKGEGKDKGKADDAAAKAAKAAGKKGGGDGDDEGGGGDGNGDGNGNGGSGGAKALSRKARKKASRLSVAELKQLVASAEVVEAHDVTSADPRLLVYLKAYRNTVPVPRHWCHKRKYLQGKRGIEKQPFQLPEFIASTGIEKIRSALLDKEAEKTAKQKGRGRVAPTMGKIDIDYQVLHDAFFKYQKKPYLTHHGDVYYEGKEFEVKLREKAPGVLSGKLKEALAIPDGAPPPWLINMQRYGPPPAYPNLKLPGLNAPIPAGASFGYQPGEWGKPPVDEYGRPLYGDVFSKGAGGDEVGSELVDRTLWGELGSESEPEEDDDDSAAGGDGGGDDDDMSGAETPSHSLVSGMTSVASGLDTPESQVDLRKRAGSETPDTSGMSGLDAPKQLYQVVGQQQTAVGGGLFGADKQYVLPSGAESLAKSDKGGEEPDLLEEQRKRKRQAEKERDGKAKKKYDDFKF
jgi:splicing factor 3B subunit 2